MRLGSDLEWVQLQPDTSDFKWIDEILFSRYPASDNLQRPALVTYDIADLPSHPGTKVVWVETHPWQPGPFPVYAFLHPGFALYVAGCAKDVYALNNWIKPVLDNEAEIADYIRLWMELARGREGWRLVESVEDVFWNNVPGDDADGDKMISIVGSAIKPLQVEAPDRHGRWAVRAMVQKQGAIDVRTMMLWPDGLVQVKGGDQTVLSDPALATPEPLLPFSGLVGTPLAEHATEGAESAALLLDGVIRLNSEIQETTGTDSMDDETDKKQPDWNLSAVFDQLAGILLARALKQDFPAKRGSDAVQGFFDYLRDYRPTVVIETPYRELREEFARFISKGCGLSLNLDLANRPERVSFPNKPTRVVLLTESTFARNPDGTETDAGQLLAPIVRSPHVALMVVERLEALPQDARDMIDLKLTVPRLDESAFWACTAALFGKAPRRRNADWIRYVMPRDMARIAAATRDLPRYLRELEATIHRRLAQYTAPDAPSLHELQGLGEARYRAEELAADIRAALDGTIGWNQVDRGYLLVGPPGTGKTTLVRALAKDCGIRFILASASRWQEQSSLGPHIQSIRRTFHEARLYAPAILFIDEIDSIGSRNRVESHNSQYQTVVINTVLEELQGFEGREGVIVIGATNNVDGVDEALRRPGRLDRIVQVPYPNVAALANIYTFYLEHAAREGVAAENVDVQRLAQLTFGRTGSHVELYVRGAVRRVRRTRRNAIIEQDIVDEITARPPEGFGQVLSPELMRRIAVHEAGHALISMTGPDRSRDIPMISITPRSDGSLGFVARAPSDMGVLTREGMEESIRVMLGGRAAEEMVFGRENISGGSGGSGESDLARATQAVLWLLTEFGFSEAGGLLWIDWRGHGTGSQMTAEAIRNLPMGDEILHEARRMADHLYAETLDRLQKQRPVLDRIVTALMERQELSSVELRAVIDGR